MLPDGSTYVEPFAGMLGVLLARTPAPVEIANDADGRIVNWWRVVRHQPAELERRLMLTPTSRIEHADAAERVNARAAGPLLDKGDIEWAADFTVALVCSIGGKISSWSRRINHYTGRTNKLECIAEKVTALSDRLRHVQLEHCDAVDLIRRCDRPGAVIYCDPPYRTVGDYYEATVDHDDLEHALAAVEHASVAVSGYPGDRHFLEEHGWRRSELTVQSSGGGLDAAARRTECLWTNYDPGSLL